MKRRVWLALCLLGCAVMAGSIEVSPTYQIFTLKPGKKAVGGFNLTNNEAEKLTISLYSKDWFVLPGNEAYKAPDWLTFKDKKITIEKGATEHVEFYVEAPKGAQGELVGMVSFGITGEIESDINKIFSVAIYNTIQGTEKLKGDLRAIMITPSSSTLDVSVLLTNQGNVHIRPTGWFRIQNSKGQIVANIMLEKGRPVYPGKEGVYSGKIKDVRMMPGIYKAFITITDVDRKKEIVDESRKFELKENNVVELR